MFGASIAEKCRISAVCQKFLLNDVACKQAHQVNLDSLQARIPMLVHILCLDIYFFLQSLYYANLPTYQINLFCFEIRSSPQVSSCSKKKRSYFGAVWPVLKFCSVLQNLAERKKKSLSERAQAEEEMEEIRRSYQQELDKLRQLLKKARTSTDQAAAEQVRSHGSFPSWCLENLQ